MGEGKLALQRGLSNDVVQQLPAQQWAQLIHPAVQSYQSVVNGAYRLLMWFYIYIICWFPAGRATSLLTC